jgi:arylsulfatase A-like enzyme
LFSNRKLALAGREPHIMDVAPTVLRAFGVAPPEHMDGQAIAVEGNMP